jgi:hypothetical protein
MNLSHITITDAIWQNRLDKANAEKKAQHDAKEASKPEEDRVAFVPQTLEEYVATRVADIEASYARQIEHEELEAVRQDPVQYNRLMTALTNPGLRQQLSDIIDAANGGQGA